MTRGEGREVKTGRLAKRAGNIDYKKPLLFVSAATSG